MILGFNCFSNTVGACCLRAPEHSDAFNRTVRLYQVIIYIFHPFLILVYIYIYIYIYTYINLKNVALITRLLHQQGLVKSPVQMKKIMTFLMKIQKIVKIQTAQIKKYQPKKF